MTLRFMGIDIEYDHALVPRVLAWADEVPTRTHLLDLVRESCTRTSAPFSRGHENGAELRTSTALSTDIVKPPVPDGKIFHMSFDPARPGGDHASKTVVFLNKDGLLVMQ